jgi:GNAT superfamily N-acetyltransferase
MPSLANLMEDYRNWRGRQDWEQGKGWQDFFGGDPRAQEQFEKLSGFGTDAGGLVGMIKASHGSPHLFDKFDFSKIGTGEGAQAYGHGGYFAQGFDSPVAKEYARVLSEKGGWDVSTISGLDNNSDWANLSDRARAEITAAYHNQGDTGAKTKLKELAFWQKGESDEKNLQNLLNNFDSLHKPLGHLYNVELKWPDAAREAADPLGMEHFLDWYQPFGEQPKNVKDAVIKALHSDAYKASQAEPIAFNPSAEQSWMADLFTGEKPDFVPSDYYDLYRNRTGEQIYKALSERLGGEKQASAKLRETGLPGMRYQDEKSRSMPFGYGTHNFVMFDDQFPEIVSRNGVSLSDLLKSETPQSKLDALIQNLESQGLNVDAFYNPKSNQVSLSRLVVPKESRGQGIGTQAMQDLVNFADEQNALMSLSPSTDFGATSVNRLKDFYSRFGFVPNKGKYKDFSISESMYRPKK